jgi:hypothetical protein
MKIGKGLAIFVSVLFFLGIMGLFLFIFLSLFPGFSFSENPIVRIISLLIIIGITQGFYNYLRK